MIIPICIALEGSSWESLLAIPLAALLILVVSNSIKYISKNKSTGKETIADLESRGLFSLAAKEIDGPDQITCHCLTRNGAFDKLAYRNNILTPNFIFVMTENIILTYDQIDKAYIIRYHYDDGEIHHKNDVFTLLTTDGREVDLMNFEGGRYPSRKIDILDQISFILTAKNPNCTVTLDVKETRLDNKSTHYE